MASLLYPPRWVRQNASSDFSRVHPPPPERGTFPLSHHRCRRWLPIRRPLLRRKERSFPFGLRKPGSGVMRYIEGGPFDKGEGATESFGADSVLRG